MPYLLVYDFFDWHGNFLDDNLACATYVTGLETQRISKDVLEISSICKQICPTFEE
jgi:hypothetical protein